MGISSMGNVGSLLNFSSLGTRWRPKASNIRVGRDVAALTSTAFCGGNSANRVLTESDEMIFRSGMIFQQAKSAAKAGNYLNDFRTMVNKYAQGEIENGVFAKTTSDDDLSVTIAKNGDYSIKYTPAQHPPDALNSPSGLVQVFKKDNSGTAILVQEVRVTDDMSISWGGNGEPQIRTGKAARINGVLAARGTDDILIRHSGVDVEAGEGTTVFNLSSRAGNYSGGNNVTYLGAYTEGNFTDTSGRVNFAGYFENSTFSELTGQSTFSGVFQEVSVTLESGYGTYSGYFSASQINAGHKGNLMSGLFIQGCTVEGGEGADIFNGRFVNSSVDGGDGNDTFGNNGSLNRIIDRKYTRREDGRTYHYNAMDADFVNTEIKAGDGNDTIKGIVLGGSINLDTGTNRAEGIFSQTTVNGGQGDDKIAATYTRHSEFNAGMGHTSINLGTAIKNTITTGGEHTTITLGKENHTSHEPTWQTTSEYFDKDRPAETGELARNLIFAKQGDSEVTIHNGEGTSRLTAGIRKETNEADEEQNQDQDASPLHSDPNSQGTISSWGLEHTGSITKGSLGILTASLDQALSSLLQATAKEADLSTYEHDLLGQAMLRHQELEKMEPEDKGEVAAKVYTGSREIEVFHDTKHYNEWQEFEVKGMVNTVRRYDKLTGTYSSMPWSRIY